MTIIAMPKFDGFQTWRPRKRMTYFEPIVIRAQTMYGQ